MRETFKPGYAGKINTGSVVVIDNQWAVVTRINSEGFPTFFAGDILIKENGSVAILNPEPRGAGEITQIAGKRLYPTQVIDFIENGLGLGRRITNAARDLIEESSSSTPDLPINDDTRARGRPTIDMTRVETPAEYLQKTLQPDFESWSYEEQRVMITALRSLLEAKDKEGIVSLRNIQIEITNNLSRYPKDLSDTNELRAARLAATRILDTYAVLIDVENLTQSGDIRQRIDCFVEGFDLGVEVTVRNDAIQMGIASPGPAQRFLREALNHEPMTDVGLLLSSEEDF